MSLKLYTPRGPQLSVWPGFGTLNNRLIRLFDDQPSNRNASRSSGWTPPVSVEETADTFVLTAEAPGLTLEDFSVELENNVITISGEKRVAQAGATGEVTADAGGDVEGDVGAAAEADVTEDTRFLMSERRYGSFRRSFTLPRRVDAERIDARFEHGVLTVSLPKAAEAKSRTIEVTS